MTGSAKKFGTFGGVFTPSVLTILGVIMYLRLPWVVGNAGLYAALGIVLVAHVISVTTGLSVSSIATDKRVGAGGPYYVISRSLGLPIGGTIGLALFVGLSFSISLYVIGFSESLLGVIGAERTLTNIRLCGTATVVLLTIITFISTSLAIKTQYLILALIAASLVSIALGNPEPPPRPLLEPPADGESLAVLFGVFFPAVTGFTAGVNMSGDLKDPKRAIPIGTIGAIATGLVVYIGLTVYLALRVDPQALREDPKLLLHVSAFPEAVVGGIWGATLSSALGSILGAPRILQSMSADRVTPRFFAKGAGPTNEPRRALMLAFLVGEAGILIGELDVIARVVSMVFLALYGVINIAFAIESWASPDFRPSFQISKWWGIVGAATCFLVMIQLDPLAMAASLVLLAVLFAFLSRRRLALDSGDAWEGVWSSLVRTGLRRLSGVQTHRRNWKPNILAFSRLGVAREPSLRDFALALIGNVGLATEFQIEPPRAESDPSPQPEPEGKKDEVPEREIPAGLFEARLTSDDPHRLVPTLARFHGYTGVRPNSVLLPWSALRGRPEAVAELVATLDETQQNLFVFAPGDCDASGTIDVWWTDELGNLALGVTLARLLSRSDSWRSHPVRVLLLTGDPAADDLLSVEAREYVGEARLVAEVSVRHLPPTAACFQEVIAEESRDAALVMVPLPEALGAADLEAYEPLVAMRGRFLGYRSKPPFERVLRVELSESGRPDSDGSDEDAQDEADAPPFVLPEHPKLAELTVQFAERLEAVLAGLRQRCIARLYDLDLAAAVRGSLEALGASLSEADDDARLEAAAAWVAEVAELTQSHLARVDERRRVLEEALGEVLDPSSFVDDPARIVAVRRRKRDFAIEPGDPPETVAAKRAARLRLLFAGRTVKTRIPVGLLGTYYRDQLIRRAVKRALRDARRHHHDAILALGRSLNRLGRDLAVVELDELDATLARYLDEVERIEGTVRERRAANFARLRAAERSLVAEYAADIDRLDIWRFARRQRRVLKPCGVDGLAAWHRRARLAAERAKVGVELAAVLQDIRRAARVLEGKLFEDVLRDVMERCRQLRDALDTLEQEGAVVDLFAAKDSAQAAWDPRGDLDEFATAVADATDELPELWVTCNDEALLHGDETTPLEEVEVALRRGVDAAAHHELLARVESATTRAHAISDGARTTLQELVHLIALQRRADSDEVDRDATQSVVERARAILDQRIEDLEKAARSLADASREGRVALASVANAYDLEALRNAAAGRRGSRAQLVKEERPLGRRLRDELGRLMGGLLYRRSHGVLLAMKLRTVSERAAAHSELRSLVRAVTPSPEVLATVPPFYQQLFLARGAPGGPFRVKRGNRDETLLSGPGLLVVAGEPGSGKTSRIQHLAATLSPPTLVWAQQPEGGATSVREMDRALVHGSRWNTSSELLRQVVDGSLVVVDDLELWWERREGGLAAVEHLLGLIDEHGHRLRFIVGINEHAYAALDRLLPLTASASSVLRCDPFDAEELHHAIMRRHRSTGLRFELGGRGEESLGEWDLARLFSAHFDQSSGNVAAALRGWLAHIAAFDEGRQTLTIRRPRVQDWSLLDELDGDAKTLLVQLILHREASRARLARVMRQADRALDATIRGLVGAGVLTCHHSRGYAINPYLRHAIIAHFRQRGLT